MGAVQPHTTSLALEPMDASIAEDHAAPPAANGSPAPAATQDHELPLTAADEFLAAAAKEYREGHVDEALWVRASEQAGQDESLVLAAYLRARATALRLQKRERRAERQMRRIAAKQDAQSRKVEAKTPAATPSTGAVRARRRHRPKARYAVAAATAALASIVAAVALTSSPHGSGSIEPPNVSAVTRSVRPPVPSSPSAAAQPVAATPSVGATDGDSPRAVEATVQQLKDAGNWNVLVLYASKWTREQPKNAAAWNDLSLGYSKLHQYDDALAAATKAAELSPEEASLWRHLGEINLALDRLPEAGQAFDRALAANSDDPDALCGAAMVARRSGRSKDADAITSRAVSAGGSCRTPSDGESVTVTVRNVETSKPASPVRR